jgi:hypothetical protein
MTDSSYGFVASSVSPDFEGTNSLLMKRPEGRVSLDRNHAEELMRVLPVGCVHLAPLGAVSSIDSAIFKYVCGKGNENETMEWSQQAEWEVNLSGYVELRTGIYQRRWDPYALDRSDPARGSKTGAQRGPLSAVL